MSTSLAGGDVGEVPFPEPGYRPRVIDWKRWHEDYEDPSSDLSCRLEAVTAQIRAWADGAPAGPLRVISMCAGQGHDVVGALRDHRRRSDFSGVLVELDPRNVELATRALTAAGLLNLRAKASDAADLMAYESAAPADLVLACGVFGNIVDGDIQTTIAALPMLCAEGATVVWTRHRRKPDLTPTIRQWFAVAGFIEQGFESPAPGSYAVGTHHYAGPPKPLVTGAPLFAFIR